MDYRGRAKLGYTCYGDAKMPTLVLLQGLAMPALAWPEEFIANLVCRGLHVIAVENRDVGDSEHFDFKVSRAGVFEAGLRCLTGKRVLAPYSVDDMARDVELLMDNLGVSRFHIAGVSMGGMIAQSLACQVPQRVISMTCLSTTTGNPKMMLGSLGGVVSMIKVAIGKGEDKEEEARRLREFARAIGTPGAYRDDAQIGSLMAMRRAKGITKATVQHHLLAVFAGKDRRKKLEQLAVPTLVIHGAKDKLLPLRAGKEIAQTIKGAQMLVIDGMGHDLPKKYLKKIAESLAGHCYAYAIR